VGRRALTESIAAKIERLSGLDLRRYMCKRMRAIARRSRVRMSKSKRATGDTWGGAGGD